MKESDNDMTDIRRCRKHNQRFDVADGQECSGCESERMEETRSLPEGCECTLEEWIDMLEIDEPIPEVCEEFNEWISPGSGLKSQACYDCGHLKVCHKKA